ncbi:ATP-binding cassette, subfamily C, CydD [Desulfonatronum thiosulfatophilum]|uniref:ATP-binding cassette, subfamily C, CydD n=1 Tax=Desulfonatronum thiosulfatophilum TaxID=617002 RepID=A0A1G6AI67_9BACT|nr:thiol reductant ABC exporter subunit CydD [Desulfonatronum thiosulfatophilum]SDB08087.1 ATP-binding cassette, subfamily C, CydD [Desulfonatronum thiosulfatophilum]
MTKLLQQLPSAPEKWLRAAARQVQGLLLVAVSLGFVAGIVLIVQAGILAWVVHEVLFEGRRLADLLVPIIALPGLMLLRAGLVWGGEQLGFQAAAQVKSRIRMQLYDHLQALGPDRLRARSSGDLAHYVADGAEGLEAYYSRYLPQAAAAALIPLAVLAFVFPLDLVSGLILLFTAPFIPLFMILIGKRAERINQRQWRRLASLSARFLDSLQGLTTLKLFNATRREAEIIARITDNYRETTVSVLRVAFLSALVLEFLSTVSVAVVAVIIGFKLLSGTMLFQTGFFILLLAPEFYLPLRSLGTHYHSRLSAMAAAEGLLALLAEQPGPEKQGGRLRPEWSSVRLELEAVSFRHGDGPMVLHQVSRSIPAGSFAVLAGPSGAGKTTLLRILLGTVAPSGGRVLVNNADLAEVDQDAWLRHVSWMPQNPFILPGTIWENILLNLSGEPSADDWKKLDAMATLTGLDEDLAALPDGWWSLVEEGGGGLSGGQRQRLTLNRALCKPAPVLLLDEPTAHLDEGGKATVLAALRTMAGERTLVVASHDEQVRNLADVVLELGTLEGSS